MILLFCIGQLIHIWNCQRILILDKINIFIFHKIVGNILTKVCVFYYFQISEVNITEHIEGDATKFALWTGRAPISEYKIVLKAQTLDVKQVSFPILLLKIEQIKVSINLCITVLNYCFVNINAPEVSNIEIWPSVCPDHNPKSSKGNRMKLSKVVKGIERKCNAHKS